jgi:outer membrane protein OmpU
MKKVLFATTAFAALAAGGSAMADITLYGSARLGLYYNDDAENELQTTSRTRFGVTMSGETDSGITFGADMRADHTVNDDADSGQQGEAFVSGAFGTLSFGDTNGADEQWVGDLNGDLSLTGLGEYDETAFVSNGGTFAEDDTYDFAENAEARPTIRYDFDIAGFGLSLSSNSGLTDIGVGTGYQGTVAGIDLELGLGYYNFAGFTTDDVLGVVVDPDTELPVTDIIEEGAEIDDGEQYSAVLGFGAFGADMNVIYTHATANDLAYQTAGIGGEYTFDAVTVGAYYRIVFDTDGFEDVIDLDSDDDVYGLTASYDLGGGARIAGGVVNDYSETWTADLGIDMSF